MDLRTGELPAAGRCDRIILGPLLASLSASFLEVFERQPALPEPAHPRRRPAGEATLASRGYNVAGSFRNAWK